MSEVTKRQPACVLNHGENPSGGAGSVVGKCSLSLSFLICQVRITHLILPLPYEVGTLTPISQTGKQRAREVSPWSLGPPPHRLCLPSPGSPACGLGLPLRIPGEGAEGHISAAVTFPAPPAGLGGARPSILSKNNQAPWQPGEADRR